MFCTSFSHNTTFRELIQLCETFQVDIDITEDSYYKASNVVYPANTVNLQPAVEHNLKKTAKEKLDINNASEIEITALPGVSIVLAKKLIKKREEIGGFKSVDDVCIFLHLKSHIENQLRELICVNKMKGSLNIKRNQERSVDL